jgi:hypothetical protein
MTALAGTRRFNCGLQSMCENSISKLSPAEAALSLSNGGLKLPAPAPLGRRNLPKT